MPCDLSVARARRDRADDDLQRLPLLRGLLRGLPGDGACASTSPRATSTISPTSATTAAPASTPASTRRRTSSRSTCRSAVRGGAPPRPGATTPGPASSPARSSAPALRRAGDGGEPRAGRAADLAPGRPGHPARGHTGAGAFYRRDPAPGDGRGLRRGRPLRAARARHRPASAFGATPIRASHPSPTAMRSALRSAMR